MTRKNKRGRRAPDASELFGGPSGGNRRDRRKEAQLCAQVREALSLALADVEDDEILELFVLDVVPAPDAGRLAVQLELPAGADPDAIRERLDRLKGRLRGEVASAIHRKKTPSLVFELIPVTDEEGR